MESTQKFDLVLFGATGFTGQFVVEEVARVAELEKEQNLPVTPLTWAIAGRNEEKLKAALVEAKTNTGLSMGHVGIIRADVTDQESLKKMAASAKVVINTVGPYTLYGEPVVKACVEAGTSHVDITGEPMFMESMQLKYEAEAKKNGCYIVSACGIDSIPADVGTAHIISKFPGDLSRVDGYLSATGKKHAKIHTGTLESLALTISTYTDYRKIHSKLFPTKLPAPEFNAPNSGIAHYNDDLKLSALRFPSDEFTVYRSQHYRHDVQGLRSVQYRGFMETPGHFISLLMCVAGFFFAALCYFSFTREILLKHPEILSLGFFSRAGPSRESLKKLCFKFTLKGLGWSQKLSEPTDKHATPPDARATVTIEGPDPGYGATSLMMVASAMCLLREKENCPSTGGVIPPGAAFANTGIVKRMTDRGMVVSFSMDN